jgi:two-component system, OmpR family, KDP operon response regulator KdpE
MTEQPLRILVVDDEPQIRRLLRVSLGAQGYQVHEAARGEEAITLAAVERPDIIILDLGLPDVDGLQVIRRVREWTDTPIIVLSVREQETQKVEAFTLGADDYVTKPFGMAELLARIQVALRHRLQAEAQEPVFRSGDLAVDLARRTVSVAGKDVRLTPTEYDLLHTLVTHAGKVMTHQQLLRAVWGPGFVSDTHYLRVYIGQLRQKIEADPTQPRHIITEPGVGYRLREEAPGG